MSGLDETTVAGAVRGWHRPRHHRRGAVIGDRAPCRPVATPDGVHRDPSGTPTPLGAALEYAARGWPVLPLHDVAVGYCSCSAGRGCTSAGKHPRTRNGVRNASTDPEVVIAWWADHPQAGIGVAAGRVSGLVVVDVDPRNGGDETLAELERRHGALPDTLQAETGGGGRHLLFRHVDGIDYRGKLGPGVDIVADGRYFVAAPTLHLTGRRYAWVSWPNTVAVMPAWLAQRVEQARPASSRAVDSRSDPAGSSNAPVSLPTIDGLIVAPPVSELPERAEVELYHASGSRHRRIYIAALSMLRAGFTLPAVEMAVMASPLRQKVDERGRSWLYGQVLHPAAREVTSTPSYRAEDFLEATRRHFWLAEAATDEWASRTGRRLRNVLWNFQRLSMQRGGGRFTGSLRDLADVGPASKPTVQRSWPLLVAGGWLRVCEFGGVDRRTPSGAAAASVWELTIPPGRNEEDHLQVAGLLSGSGPERSDLWRLAGHPGVRRQALGVAADTLRLLAVHGPLSIAQLCDLTGLTRRGQINHTAKLGRGGSVSGTVHPGYGLLDIDADGVHHLVDDWLTRLDDIAESTGATEAHHRMRERHQDERDMHRAYQAARYGPPTCTSCGTIGEEANPSGACPECAQ